MAPTGKCGWVIGFAIDGLVIAKISLSFCKSDLSVKMVSSELES